MEDYLLELIVKYLRGECSHIEASQLTDWLEASPENKRFFADIAANWRLHETLTSPSLESDTERMLSRMDARIEAGSQKSRRRFGRMPLMGVAVAALSLCLVLGGVFLLRNLSLSPSEHLETLANQTDETSTMVLEDGTHVYLRPGAVLSYNVLTLKGRRVAELSGDAYFDVARDEDKPFLVRTANIGVQVLGTSFSVSTQQDITQVVLERGSVRLLSQAGEPLLTMQPNQKAIWRPGGNGVRVEAVYASSFVTDKYNLVAFYDETLPEILKALQERFDVRISCSDIPDGKRYNLAFLKSDSLENVIAILEYMTGTECHIAHN